MWREQCTILLNFLVPAVVFLHFFFALLKLCANRVEWHCGALLQQRARTPPTSPHVGGLHIYGAGDASLKMVSCYMCPLLCSIAVLYVLPVCDWLTTKALWRVLLDLQCKSSWWRLFLGAFLNCGSSYAKRWTNAASQAPNKTKILSIFASKVLSFELYFASPLYCFQVKPP